MDRPFFIMMYSQNGKVAMPIIKTDEHGNENVAFFGSEGEARSTAEDHEFCKAFGYEIFEMGMGE